MSYNFEINRELRELNNERAVNEHYFEKVKEKSAYMLKNDMGKDIDSVLSGQVKVKLSFFDKLKHRIKCFLDNIFNIF